ncbi:hypothetical protein B0H13DRAFT_1858223 [Mycena leptocephala]|nr:hypothetical protein B0H13DRAFT_1858223 [Mycena leptocephala]
MAPTATTVTLWQFGLFRLLQGDSTLPLQPQAMATDPKLITTDQSGFAITTTPPRASRTIIASASGWVEPWGTTWAIGCNFVNSASTVIVNSGVLKQVVLAVQPTSTPVPGTTTPLESTNTVPLPSSIPIHNEIQPGRTRQRLRRIQQEVSPVAYVPIIVPFDNSARTGLGRATKYDPAETGLPTYYAPSQLESNTTNPPSRLAINTPSAAQRNLVKVRRTEASLGNGGVAPSQTADIPTSELIATLLQRIDDRERWVEQPPPVYET